jgi:hypothetical protein
MKTLSKKKEIIESLNYLIDTLKEHTQYDNGEEQSRESMGIQICYEVINYINKIAPYTPPTTATACRHCGATIEHHRGIDRYCGGSFATTFWNP